MSRHAGAGQHQVVATHQRLQMQVNFIITPISYKTRHNRFIPATVCSASSSSDVHTSRSRRKGREHGRICKDRSTVLYTEQAKLNTIRMQYLLLVAPCSPPDPRSGQAASNCSKAAPTAVQAARAGLQLPPRPLSCCYINQSHPGLPIARQLA